MSETKQKCCEMLHNNYSFRGVPCGKTAKIEHEGKWYCGTHSPLLKQKRIDERNARWEQQSKRRKEEEQQERKRQERSVACVSACEGISNPSDFVRAARELGKLVKNVMDVELHNWDSAAATAIRESLFAFRAAGGGE